MSTDKEAVERLIKAVEDLSGPIHIVIKQTMRELVARCEAAEQYSNIMRKGQRETMAKVEDLILKLAAAEAEVERLREL
jgi:hypothetical protein